MRGMSQPSEPCQRIRVVRPFPGTTVGENLLLPRNHIQAQGTFRAHDAPGVLIFPRAVFDALERDHLSAFATDDGGEYVSASEPGRDVRHQLRRNRPRLREDEAGLQLPSADAQQMSRS